MSHGQLAHLWDGHSTVELPSAFYALLGKNDEAQATAAELVRIDPKFREELDSSLNDKYIPSEVANRRFRFWIGLVLISFGILIELVATIVA
jgi:hypothetical protein